MLVRWSLDAKLNELRNFILIASISIYDFTGLDITIMQQFAR